VEKYRINDVAVGDVHPILKNQALELPTAGTFGQAASWCQTWGIF
jgi:hypothetical protein